MMMVKITSTAKLMGDTGADDEIIYSEWDFEKMVRQLRESVGLGVDAIAMMGHPGNEALMPLAKQAAENGIIMTYQNVDPGEVRAKYGGGSVSYTHLRAHET